MYVISDRICRSRVAHGHSNWVTRWTGVVHPTLPQGVAEIATEAETLNCREIIDQS